MGIETVSTLLRTLDVADVWNEYEQDVAYAKIHHTYNPSRNYCTVEFRMPAITRQFPQEYSRETIDTYHYPHLHRMKFNEVENLDFHAFMRVEGKSTIDKIRYREGNNLITYYFSNTRTLGLLKHDYMMAMLIYINYPARNFTRQTPCKRLHPECIPGCIKILQKPIVNWIHDPEPNTARLDKYFFSYIGEKHRLCMGYTIEEKKSNDTCFEPMEPKYYTLDLDAKYFKEAIWNVREWENKILEDRKNLDDDIYMIYDGSPENKHDGEDLESTMVNFSGYTGNPYLVVYNYAKMENVPKSIKDAIDLNNFTMLWQVDMASLNARNSIHKWNFNHWQELCKRYKNGWWCAWDVSETIDSGSANAAALGDVSGDVEARLIQTASAVGWGATGDSSSSDTQYDIIFPQYNGYTYESHFEPLPDRGGGFI